MKNIKFYVLITTIFCYSCTSEITFDPEAPKPPSNAISDLIISEISTYINTDATTGSTRNHYVELYNGTEKSVDLTQYAIGYQAVTDEKTLTPWNFTTAANVLVLTGTLDNGKAYVIASPQASTTAVPRDITWGTTSTSSADASKPLQLSGNSAIALLKKDAAGTYVISGTNYKIIDVFGAPNVERITFKGSSSSRNNWMWVTAGELLDTRNRTFWRKATVKAPNPVWNATKESVAADSEWTLSGDRLWVYTNVGIFTK
ncbi:lamin tail domain-containing protein [Flavobacterium nackdongense]|uniref:Lamin tail domain-containing protein n=1 Tax=Flavobacterium nackdongense TaxID=2547394 RepID=A0A4P6YBH0_9FLAO|nr:lamin tail domain-containing protein [Flavobacterium nackdongense]QBN17613.1 lamin tail domain-containing protein [Flavobacterium nackdongense]